MASSTNPSDFKSPEAVSSRDISGTQSPGNNPFDVTPTKEQNVLNSVKLTDSPFNVLNTSLKDLGRLSLAPLNFNSSDMARESLGILPNASLYRDSLSMGLSSVKEILDAEILSDRESLGVLNLSTMDLGRESIEIFNIPNSFLGRKSIGNKIEEEFSLDDFNFNNIELGLQTVKKSPLQAENTLPKLLLSTSTTQEEVNLVSLSEFNNAFILPQSRILSAVSSGSSCLSFNPYFNSRSLEEPSKISGASSQKDIETSLSVLDTTDAFNDAFRISTADNNKHSMSQILTSTSTKHSFASDIEVIKKRIQSLPVAFEDNILADLDFQTKVSNVSFQDAMIFRGIEDEKEFDDSVFLEAKRVASIIADTSFAGDETSFDSKEHNILDATSQPEWPSDLDSSHSNLEDRIKSPKCDKDAVLKQVDKMLGMQPVNLEEKLHLKNANKSHRTSMENISENVSKISRTSPNPTAENQSDVNNFSQNTNQISGTSRGVNAENQSCTSNNFSQNISKISETSPGDNAENQSCTSDNFSQNISKISETSPGANAENLSCTNNNFSQNLSKISMTSQEGNGGNQSSASKNFSQNLSKIIQTSEENVSRLIENLSDILNDNGNLSQSNEGQHLLHSLANLLCDYKNKTPNRSALHNTSTASIASNASDTNKKSIRANLSATSNHSNVSARNGNISSSSRHSNISQNRVSLSAGKLRKSKVGVVVTKKGPLRAVLPVENMVKEPKIIGKGIKIAVTSEKTEENLISGLRSKKTSTPIHEPKLKPMAASTPAGYGKKDFKENAVSPVARPKYARSLSHQPKTSNSLENAENLFKTRESTSNISKPIINKSIKSTIGGTIPVRRNSINEGTSNPQNDSEGPVRIKRSFSTGKESKILSALSRVRQNILNSPYYNPKRSASTSDVLTENANKTGSDLNGCRQELKRLSLIARPRKPGKENLKP